MNRRNILVAEDDAPIRDGLSDALESEGYGVTAVRDGKAALGHWRQGGFDLILLDVMMPEVSGYDVCREIRKKDPYVPVLMLTAKGQEIDKVVGLELGADDYMTKPFGLRELLARVAALLRRAELRSGERDPMERVPEQFAIGEARIDRKTYEVTAEGTTQALTQRELKLLAVFASRPNEVLSRDLLLDVVWGVDYLGTTRTLDQHVAQVRKKLGRDAAARLETVHGVGYRYRAG